MRRVDRNSVPEPAILCTPGVGGQKEYDEARLYYQTRPLEPEQRKKFKAYSFAAYSKDEVKLALRTMFSGKCAYCESPYLASGPGAVEHYRPKGRVRECPDHPGYWWLAMKWTNLVPSCTDCNSNRGQTTATADMTMGDIAALLRQPPQITSGKQDAFPTANDIWVQDEGDVASEKPLLLDPTTDDPDDYLRWRSDIAVSVVLPMIHNGKEDSRAVASIRVYGLNRLSLVQERTELLNEMKLKRQYILEYIEEAEAASDPDVARRFTQRALRGVEEIKQLCLPGKKYSALAKAFVSELVRELEGGADPP
jgi:uncharacterized protein (TIGR02646 family)